MADHQEQEQDYRHDLMSRQHGIVHGRVADLKIAVVGLGMVGSWTCQAVSRMLPKSLEGWDFDRVSPENLGSQAYGTQDLKDLKSFAMESLLRGLPFTGRFGSFPPPSDSRLVLDQYDVLVSCVDTMSGRREIAKWCRDRSIRLFLDCRVLSETAALVSVCHPAGYSRYLRNLSSDEEVPPVPCGQTGTAYVGLWLASRVAATINNWCRGVEPARLLVWQVGANVQIADSRINRRQVS